MGWVIWSAVFLGLAAATGNSIRGALLPVVLIAAVFTPFVMIPTIRKMGPSQGTADVRPTASLRLVGRYEEIFDRCVEAIGSLAGARVVRADRLRGLITARVALTPASFGERVRVNVASEGDGVEIRLSSRPKVPFTLLDQGKNQQNLEAIVEYLTEAPVSIRSNSPLRYSTPGFPLAAVAVGAAAFLLQLVFWAVFRRSGTGHLWFALINVGLAILYFGSTVLAARRVGAGARVQALALAGAVVSVVGQFIVLIR